MVAAASLYAPPPHEQDPVRAALEEAARRPLPSPEDRARLMTLVADTGKGTMTAGELRAMLAARRPDRA